MKGMELQIAAQKVAKDFIEKKSSMNKGIIKIAQTNHLNNEQIKRLVEESNKAAFMIGFEKDGSQTFDVATFEEVEREMNPGIEKKASYSVEKLNYSDSIHKSRLGNYQTQSFEKIASDTDGYTEEQIVGLQALNKVAEEHNNLQKAFIDLENQVRGSYGYAHKGDELIKTAEHHSDNRAGELVRLSQQIEKTGKMYNYLLEKTGGTDKAILTGVGAAGAGILGLGVLAAKSVPTLVKAIPGKGMHKAFTAMNVDMVYEGAKAHAEKMGTFDHKMTGPLANSFEKEASFGLGLQHALELIGNAAISPAGALGGLIGIAAKKLGGGIALTMNDRKFNRSFDTIMKRNPDLNDRKEQVREYFDVISRHSPSIAKDPLVAENLVKNFDAFGGVDFNTIKSMHEMESKDLQARRDGVLSPFSSIGKLI